MIIELPESKKNLSEGGKVAIDERDGTTMVIFYLQRGFIDSGDSGWIYRADYNPPKFDAFGSDFTTIIKKREHWYWVRDPSR